MPVVMLLAVVVVLVAVFFVATGRGGELSYERADYAPLDLGPVSATDVALLRPPAALWGYNIQATDEALDRIVHAIRDRDAKIASLQEQLAATTSQTDRDRPAARARHPRSVPPDRHAVQVPDDLPSSGGDDAQILEASYGRRPAQASPEEVSRGDDTQRLASHDDTQRLVSHGDDTQRLTLYGAVPSEAERSDAGPSEAEPSAAGQSRTSEDAEARNQGPGGRRDAAGSADMVSRDQPAGQEDPAVSRKLPGHEHPGSGDDPPAGEGPASQTGSARSRAGD